MLQRLPIYILTTVLPTITAPAGSRCLSSVMVRMLYLMHFPHPGWSPTPLYAFQRHVSSPLEEVVRVSSEGFWDPYSAMPIVFQIDVLSCLQLVILPQDSFRSHQMTGGHFVYKWDCLSCFTCRLPHVFSLPVAAYGMQKCGHHWKRSHSRNAPIRT